jgi:hypothetical protein
MYKFTSALHLQERSSWKRGEVTSHPTHSGLEEAFIFAVFKVKLFYSGFKLYLALWQMYANPDMSDPRPDTKQG